MSSNFTVIYDACVLYPAPLRDLLMRLALTDLYRARWTDMIHDEWTRNVLRQRPDLVVGIQTTSYLICLICMRPEYARRRPITGGH